MYSKAAQVHIAVWPTSVKPYLLVCRNMAVEGRLYVIVASQKDSAVIGPDGEYITEPTSEPKTVYAEIDLEKLIEEKQIVDVVGHYARPDVFRLVVNDEPMNSVVKDSGNGG